MSQMTAVLKDSPAPGAKIARVDMPRIGGRDLLLKVRATSICGTDAHIYNWDSWAQSVIRPPLVFGHEFTGEIVEKGREVADFQIGDHVAVESHIPCDECVQCRAGMRHICDNLQIIGIHRSGCFAEFVSIPAVCAWRIPSGTPREIGSIMEPMGNAVHAVSAAHVRGKRVAIFGCGPTGLFAAAVCRAHDAHQVLAVDVNPRRMELAREAGAHEVVDGAAPDVIDRIRRLFGGRDADVVLEMSGNAVAMRNGLQVTRKGGTYVAFGISPRPVELDLSNLVILRGVTILGIVGRRMFETWEEMQRLLDNGKLNPAPVVTHRFPLTEFDRAMKTMLSGEEKCGKVVLLP